MTTSRVREARSDRITCHTMEMTSISMAGMAVKMEQTVTIVEGVEVTATGI